MNSALAINWEQLSLVIGDESTPGDDEMKDLFRLFVSDAGTRLRSLTAADHVFERTPIAKEAHKIRGAASSFGFDHVASLLRTIEAQINELSQERVEELLRETLTSFEQSVRDVQERHPELA
jgi:HPt (histidine-containing phosphotransfer) domain-containing protein